MGPTLLARATPCASPPAASWVSGPCLFQPFHTCFTSSKAESSSSRLSVIRLFKLKSVFLLCSQNKVPPCRGPPPRPERALPAPSIPYFNCWTLRVWRLCISRYCSGSHALTPAFGLLMHGDQGPARPWAEPAPLLPAGTWTRRWAALQPSQAACRVGDQPGL